MPIGAFDYERGRELARNGLHPCPADSLATHEGYHSERSHLAGGGSTGETPVVGEKFTRLLTWVFCSMGLVLGILVGYREGVLETLVGAVTGPLTGYLLARYWFVWAFLVVIFGVAWWSKVMT